MDPTANAAAPDVAEYSARGARDSSIGGMTDRHRSLSKPAMDTMAPPGGLHRRRQSVFDAAGGASGGGGLASRFAMNFPNATVFESDIVGYTKLVSNWPAQRTLNMLNQLFSMFDRVAEQSVVEKIETIGDAFMVSSCSHSEVSSLCFRTICSRCFFSCLSSASCSKMSLMPC